MDKAVRIRRMGAGDAEAVAAIEAAVFPRPWSVDAFRKEMRENPVARYLVAERDGRIIGYAGAWIVLDESHVTNVAVTAEERGRGVGTALMDRLLWYLSNLGAAYATLEVRAGNAAAQAVDRKLGVIKVGVRKKYYEDNGEDAWIMVCDHLPAAEEDFEEWPAGKPAAEAGNEI